MAAKFYVASTLTNADQAKIVINRLIDFGHEVTYDWTLHGQAFDPEAMSKIAEAELQGVVNADVLVVLWPGGRGTHVEMGAALSNNKTVFFITPPDFKLEVAFYRHKNVVHLTELNMAIEVIHKALSVFEEITENYELP